MKFKDDDKKDKKPKTLAQKCDDVKSKDEAENDSKSPIKDKPFVDFSIDLPLDIRGIIFSFLPLKQIADVVMRASKMDRDHFLKMKLNRNITLKDIDYTITDS